MTKLVCVLYVNPIAGCPKSCRGSLLKINLYPGGQSVRMRGSQSAVEGNPIFARILRWWWTVCRDDCRVS